MIQIAKKQKQRGLSGHEKVWMGLSYDIHRLHLSKVVILWGGGVVAHRDQGPRLLGFYGFFLFI